MMSQQKMFWIFTLAAIACLLLDGSCGALASPPSENYSELNRTEREDSHGSVELAGLHFEEFANPFIITCVVLIAMLCKLGFHYSGKLSSIFPESCMLVTVGIILGAVIHFSGIGEEFPHFFTPHQFFLYLLPPIVLEAAYGLNDRVFYENMGSVLIFAVVGTVLNFILIGFTLYALSLYPDITGVIEIKLVQMLVFASIIVAVDPVAVLAVFQEIGVNSVLYILVFGESLLNDGVSVVLYNVMQTYSKMDEINAIQIILGIVKFFVVTFGGFSIGLIMGFVSALITKFTRTVKVVEPIAIFGLAFMSYLLADMFALSGIISLIGCGLVQAQYSFHNISKKSRTTVKYSIKVASTASEILIFLFLGLALVRQQHTWSTGFILWTVVFCLIYRFLISYLLSFLINTFDRFRIRKIGLDEQFIMSYGGLRGAVCFSLVALLDEKQIPEKRLFITTTLAVIVFTVVIQGTTIKPLVKLLRIRLQKHEDLILFIQLNSQLLSEKLPLPFLRPAVCCKALESYRSMKVTDHIMAGIEDIIGFHGKYFLKELFLYYDDKYLKKWFERNPTAADAEITQIYEKIALRDHYDHLYVSGAKKLPEEINLTLQDMDNTMMDIDDDDAMVTLHAKRKSTQISRSANMAKFLNHRLSRNVIHEKYDPNLIRDAELDVNYHMRDKRRMTRLLETRAYRRDPRMRAFSCNDQQFFSRSLNDVDACHVKRFQTKSLSFVPDTWKLQHNLNQSELRSNSEELPLIKENEVMVFRRKDRPPLSKDSHIEEIEMTERTNDPNKENV